MGYSSGDQARSVVCQPQEGGESRSLGIVRGEFWVPRGTKKGGAAAEEFGEMPSVWY